MNTKVRSILKFWKKVPRITKQAALDFQMNKILCDAVATPMMNACALEDESDRVEYLRYYVSKALYEDNDAVVGSPVLCKNNERVGVKQIFESCIEAVPLSVHTNALSGGSFMERNKKYFESTMLMFMNHVRNGTLIFKPKYDTVSPDNHSLIEEVTSLSPFMVHWSNVPDYLSPGDFHSIAKKISGPDTQFMFYTHTIGLQQSMVQIFMISTHQSAFMSIVLA